VLCRRNCVAIERMDKKTTAATERRPLKVSTFAMGVGGRALSTKLPVEVRSPYSSRRKLGSRRLNPVGGVPHYAHTFLPNFFSSSP
jgi:hypothetical protein